MKHVGEIFGGPSTTYKTFFGGVVKTYKKNSFLYRLSDLADGWATTCQMIKAIVGPYGCVQIAGGD
jgi:hypothetical protein